MMLATFKWLLDNLRRKLAWQALAMWESTAVDERVTIAVLWMAISNSYQEVKKQLGHVRSTVAE